MTPQNKLDQADRGVNVVHFYKQLQKEMYMLLFHL